MNSTKVLLVDDNQDLAESFQELLEEDGYQVTLAASGEEAIDLCQKNSYDITFLDVKLPGVDGVKTLMQIQSLNPTAKVVMMSGYRINELLDAAMERGAISFLQKPFTIHRMLAQIRDLNTDLSQ